MQKAEILSDSLLLIPLDHPAPSLVKKQEHPILEYTQIMEIL